MSLIKIISAFFLFLFLLSVSGGENMDSEKKNPPNFILILTDDQSWVGTSYLSDPADPRTRSDYYNTPNMERIAKMGMRKQDCWEKQKMILRTSKKLEV